MNDDLIDAIVAEHRRRCFFMEQRKRLDLALGAQLRSTLGWSRALPQEQRSLINKQALDIVAEVKATLHGKTAKFAIDPEIAALVTANVRATEYFDAPEKSSTKKLEALAKRLLPVYLWVEEPDQRGFGALGLAIIVAEAGTDLVNYANPAKLWTRMGLGLFDDGHGNLVRQGGLPKTAPKEVWIAHKYSPRRRSRIWTIGKALVNGNHEGSGENKSDLKWRRIYLARKAYERDRAEASGLKVAPAGSIPKSRSDEYISLGHIDRSSQRIMEKALIKELWIRWQQADGATTSLEPIATVPSAVAA